MQVNSNTGSRSRVELFSSSETDNIVKARELNRLELRKTKVSSTINHKREIYTRKALKFDDSRISTNFKEFKFEESSVEELFLVLKNMLSSVNEHNVRFALTLMLSSLQESGKIDLPNLLAVFSEYEEILDFVLSYVLTAKEPELIVCLLN